MQLTNILLLNIVSGSWDIYQPHAFAFKEALHMGGWGVEL